MSIYDEKDLFRRMANGEDAAFRELFHEYNARLLPFIYKICKSEVIAEEMVQEVFLRVWVNREELAYMERPASWIFRVASNLSVSYLRSLQGKERQLLSIENITEPVADNVLEELTTRELQVLIERAVSQLPPKRQQIYRLSRHEGLSHKEIAEQLSLSQNTVKDQLVISLKYIREYIYKEWGGLIPVLVLIAAI
ncbi:RNA polymerase sigma factor [Chitinophaga qingshengii]|uniref:RNA polymerase sigma-70 factor n=1 Tax=Chitinophaga qingshengii TaxID=1569794 RepID=A0ABR7THI2_9BACT|nr:RNA polymerase sigma-70 factor [Chitinophaga qingshengii]MBC9928976.1 RNA polymerase sigma-70 factor [Chitinophaga qingshengii]